jgi:ABC-2 type transport system permease protein
MFAFIDFMLTIYTTISVAMFDLEGAELINSLMTMLPEAMVKAFGFDKLGTELTTYLSGYLFGFILVIFPIIFIVFTANSLVASHVDKGTMAYIISNPINRKKVITTQIAYLVATIVTLISYAAIVVIVMSLIMWPGLLEVGNYILLNIVTISLLVAISSICFLASTFFNSSKQSVGASSAIVTVFIMMNMLKGVSEDLDFLKFFTPISLLDTTKILTDSGYAWATIAGLVLFSIVVFGASVVIFDKKDLAV